VIYPNTVQFLYITATDGQSLCLIEFRAGLVDEASVQRIKVNRIGEDNCGIVSILKVYKDMTLSLTNTPCVVFDNEPAEDVGAVTLEYFDWGWEEFLNGKFDLMPLFEGQDGHKLPCANRGLLGIFEIVGKFIAHSVLHGGPGMAGVSAAVSQVVTACSLSDLRENPPVMSVEDIPDVTLQEIIKKVCE
jgi:hypothetical protein